ncbi:hypothetical protein EYR36_011295 [Pleurotus pulmonarius]|nr:hypothetical protein EYR36_011295 [Pleurotus pulmonarius]
MLPSTSRNFLHRVKPCKRQLAEASFEPNDVGFQRTQTRTTAAQFTAALDRLSTQPAKFPECLAIAAQMKAAGIRPDLYVYNALLRSAADVGLGQEAWVILEDMKASEVAPDKYSYLYLARAQRFRDSNFLWNVWDAQVSDVEPSTQTYSHVLERFILSDRLEFGIQFLHFMRTQGHEPDLRAAQAMVIKAAKNGFPRLALDLLDSFEANSTRRLDHEAWMNCLISSAESLYAEGVTRCWAVIVQELHLVPDEGLCLAVLHTAARNGLPDLATDALRVLKVIGCQWQEFHFAPVVESFVRAGRIKEAFTTLDIMRKSDIPPVPETSLPILHAISEDTQSIDNAWNLIEQMHKEGSPIDAAALNTIIQATSGIGDLQRAIGVYKSFEEYNITPDIYTFNFLLEGCIAVGHRELGDRLLADLKDAKLKPDRETYINMVLLCLTQETYEDAFFYLEEMKTAKHKPPVLVYEAIIRRCLAAGDVRYQIAVDELKETGYQLSGSLRREIAVATEEAKKHSQAPPNASVGLDGAAQRFIETGGLVHSHKDRMTLVGPGNAGTYTAHPQLQMYQGRTPTILSKAPSLTRINEERFWRKPLVSVQNSMVTLPAVCVEHNALEGHSTPVEQPLLERKLEDLMRLRSEERKEHDAQTEKLRHELSRVQKLVSGSSEKFEKQKKTTEMYEARLHELKKAATVDQKEIKELKTKLRMSEHERSQMQGKQDDISEAKKALQALDAKRREDNRERDKKIADLEKLLNQERKRREAAEARCQELQGKVNGEVNSLRQHVAVLEDEKQQAQTTLRLQTDEATSREDDLVASLERYQVMLKKVAEEYGKLASSTVSQSQFAQVRRERDARRIQVLRLERKLANSEEQVVELASLIRGAKSDNALLAQQLSQANETIYHYQTALQDRSSDDRRISDDVQVLCSSIEKHHQETRQSIEAVSRYQAELTTEFYIPGYHELLETYKLAEEELQAQRKLLDRFEAETSRTAAEHDELRTRADRLQTELAKADTELATISAKLAEAETQRKALETQLAQAERKYNESSVSQQATINQEREVVQRLSLSLQKAKLVEDGLRADLEQLTAELSEAARYQDAYYSLSEEVDGLVARSALAEDEAMRLSQFNAEILGHNNPAQRVAYVDRVRQELTETKQRLLISNRDHEAAVAENTALLEELSMYKSVMMPTNRKPRTNMTRLVRHPLTDLSQQHPSTSTLEVDDLSVQKVLAGHLPSLDVSLCEDVS